MRRRSGRRRPTAELKKYRLGPIYTPPSLQGTVALPGVWGGANWGGGAFDPATGRLYVKTTRSPAIFKMEPFNKSAQPQDRLDEVDAEYIQRSPSSFIDGVPILKPPYAHLVAIDLNRGEIAWKVPFGDAPELRSLPALKGVPLPDRLGAVGPPGAIVTKSRPDLRRRQRHGAVGVRRERRPRAVALRLTEAGHRDADDISRRRMAGRSS